MHLTAPLRIERGGVELIVEVAGVRQAADVCHPSDAVSDPLQLDFRFFDLWDEDNYSKI